MIKNLGAHDLCKMRHLDWSLSKGQNLNALQNTAPGRYRWYTHVTLPSKWGTTIWMKKYNRKKSTVICVLEDIWFHRNHQRGGPGRGPPPPPTHTHTSQPLYLEGGGLVVFVFDCKIRIYFNCVNYVYLIPKHRVYMLRGIKTVRRLKEFYAGTAPPGFEIPGPANGQNNKNLPVEGGSLLFHDHVLILTLENS